MTILPALILAATFIAPHQTVQPDQPPAQVERKSEGRKVVQGSATWYGYRPGRAAAGPALRRSLGKGWRGMTVRVCANASCVRVVLSDWCACKGDRVIDLDARSFARLAPLSRGVLGVIVARR